METKPWYQSKTVWLGVILTLSGIVPVAVELVKSAPVTPEAVILAFGGVLSVILRVWFTDTQIAK